MKTSTLTLNLLLVGLSLGCKSQQDAAPATDNAPATADAKASATQAAKVPATAPKPSPGAMAMVEPAGLAKADPKIAAWLREMAKCDLHLQEPPTDASLVERTWGDHWSLDECKARDEMPDTDLDPKALDLIMLDALGEDDRNLRLVALNETSGGYASDGGNALGKLLYAARHETDPHVGSQIAIAIDHELTEFGRLDDPSKGKPFVLALGDALAHSSNQGLMAETGLSCKFEGCDQLWINASRSNASPTLRTLAHELAQDALDKEAGCALSAVLLAEDEDPAVLRSTAGWLAQCEDSYAFPKLLARLDALGIESPAGAHLWQALELVGASDPAAEAKMSGWAKTIVDKELGDQEIREVARDVLSQ